MGCQCNCHALLAPKIQLLVLLTLSFLLHAATALQEISRAGILDGDVLPKSYEIHIQPKYVKDLEAITDYEGTVSIVLTLESPKSYIILNAADGIKVKDVSLKKFWGSAEIVDITFNEVPENEKLTIKSPTELVIGRYELTIRFTGIFRSDMSGFYKSAYKTTVDGKEEIRFLFTTKFEPTHARKAFPCFDEPRFKARFNISVDVQEGYRALSNTALEREEPPETRSGLTKLKFGETSLMSTYLVAFIIYEEKSFNRTDTINLPSNVDIAAWGPVQDVDEKQLLDFSQNVSVAAVRTLESFTDIPFNQGEGMTKIDQVALKEFASGAMENWGLITYREEYIYYSEEDSSEAEMKNVATTLSHELAHQWFGNLVTMRWWDNTWLNEGFAQFFQYFALSESYPEWRMMEQLLVDQQQGIFVSDAVEDVKPLTHDVETFEEIRGQFGSITYSKGASILRMIYYFMGEENFRKALRSYLRNSAYDNVQPAHLWSALQEFVPEGVQLPEVEVDEDGNPKRNRLGVALETWTLQPGFPVLSVVRDYENNTVTFSQERFFLKNKKDKASPKYWIPVTWSVRGETNKRKTYLFEDDEHVTVEGLGPIDDYIVVHSHGYYRVNYDQGNWLSLSIRLLWEGKNNIDAMDRAQLVDDAFTLARAGYTSYSYVVPLLTYLRQEEDPLPWVAAFRGFSFLDQFLAPSDTQGVFYSFIKNNIDVLYKGIGLGNEGTHLHRVHQANIILWACRSGHVGCLRDVTELTAQFFNNEITIRPHLRRSILCYAIRENPEDFWQKAYDRLTSDERSDYLFALTCTKDETRLNRLLTLELTDSEMASLFSNLNSNPEGLNVALDFFTQKFDNISESHPDVVNSTLRSFGERVTSRVHQQKLKSFFDRCLEEGTIDEKLVDEIENAIKENTDWLDTYGDASIKAFGREVPNLTSSTKTSSTTTLSPGSSGDGGQAAIQPLPALLGVALIAWLLHSA